MKRRFVLIIFLFAFVTGFILTSGDEYFEIMRSIELFGSTYKEVISNYVDDVSPKDLMKRGINGMLGGLDPFSNFFDETEKGEIDLLTTGKYGGIGILIDSRGDELIVMELMPGYAAQRQGIKVGDKIIAIDDEEVNPTNINRMITKVRGQPGTEVKLKIKRIGENKILEFHLIREEIKVQNISLADFIPDEDGIFYSKIDRFSKRVAEEFFEKINEARKHQQIKAVIIDLRSNPGGLLQSALEMLEFFVPKGELILFTKGRNEESKLEFYSRITPHFGDLPLVILVDENSASASEIVAGTIQDLDRGVIIGNKTFGKGLVQTVIPLPYDASLKLTTARYYTPSGRCIQKLDYLSNVRDVLRTKPDSIKVYYTKRKRFVYGDGGVTPDTIIKNNDRHEIIKELLNKGMFFKYVSEKLSGDKKIIPDDKTKSELLNDFIRFVENSGFEYKPSYLKSLDEVIKQIELDESKKKISSELKDLKEKLTIKISDELKLHEREIYSFLTAEFANQLKDTNLQLKVLKDYDDVFKTAIDVIKDRAVYNKILGLK